MTVLRLALEVVLPMCTRIKRFLRANEKSKLISPAVRRISGKCLFRNCCDSRACTKCLAPLRWG